MRSTVKLLPLLFGVWFPFVWMGFPFIWMWFPFVWMGFPFAGLIRGDGWAIMPLLLTIAALCCNDWRIDWFQAAASRWFQLGNRWLKCCGGFGIGPLNNGFRMNMGWSEEKEEKGNFYVFWKFLENFSKLFQLLNLIRPSFIKFNGVYGAITKIRNSPFMLFLAFRNKLDWFIFKLDWMKFEIWKLFEWNRIKTNKIKNRDFLIFNPHF